MSTTSPKAAIAGGGGGGGGGDGGGGGGDGRTAGGGAAFVLLYILLTLFVGIPIMLAEFSVGRNARLSPVGAVKKAGGRGGTVHTLAELAGKIASRSGVLAIAQRNQQRARRRAEERNQVVGIAEQR